LWFKNLFPQKSAYNNTGYPPVLKTNNGPGKILVVNPTACSVFSMKKIRMRSLRAFVFFCSAPTGESDWMLKNLQCSPKNLIAASLRYFFWFSVTPHI
jgi:hypothetical protein